MNTAIERMTTGFKLNHASDNAANYSIANTMQSQLSSYEVAQDNVSMGMDMVQTAMDSMDLITTHLNRIRDLAEQAANGTYGQDSLNAINQEVQARIAEIDRIVANTEFNGIQLLEGEKGESNVTGYFLKPVEQLTEDEAIAQGYTVIKTKGDLENIKNNLSGKYILMNDIDLEESCLSYSTDTSKIFRGELNGNGHVIKNLKADVYEEDVGGPFPAYRPYDYAGLFAKGMGATIKNLGLENVYLHGMESAGGFFADSSINSNINNSYVTGTVSGRKAGGLCISGCTISDSYSDAYVSGGLAAGGICMFSSSWSNVYWNTDKTTNPAGVQGPEVSYDGVTGVTTSELAEIVIDPSTLGGEQAKSIQIQVGINGDDSSNISISMGGLGLSGLSINIASNQDARNALSRVDGYLNTISSKQTEQGAVYNRLESALESTTVAMENLTSSLSTIRDADIGTESSNYIKNQILQQAAATLLATANQSPSIALQLI